MTMCPGIDRNLHLDVILFHRLQYRDSNGTLAGISGLVADSRGDRRRAWREAPVLPLDKTIRDSQYRIDDHGINALCDLMLFWENG